MNVNNLKMRTVNNMEPEKVPVKCNLCGSLNHSILFKKQGYRIVICDDCNLVFVNPRLKNELINEMYRSEMYDNQNVSLSLNRYKLRLQIFERMVGKGPILDIGCARGEFLSLAKNNGWDTYGIEPSTDASRIARECVGDTIFADTIENVRFPENFFKVITMLDVIEHLPDPYMILKTIIYYLEPGGLVVIETPNISCRKAKKLGEKWGNISPKGHLYYFDHRTLKTMLLISGYNDVWVYWGGETWPIRVLNKLSLEIGSPVGNVMVKILSSSINFIRRLKQGEAMTLYARKPSDTDGNHV